MHFPGRMLACRLLRWVPEHITTLFEVVLESLVINTIHRVGTIIAVEVRNPDNWIAFDNNTACVFRQINPKVVVARFEQLFKIL